MTISGSHERFSELIGPFLREELSREDARALEEHLSTCSECRAEVAALRALTSSPGALTEDERNRLHQGVGAALAERAPAEVIPLSPRWAGASKFLTAAAVVAVVAAAGIWAGTGGLGGSDMSAGDSSGGGDGSGGGQATEAPAELGNRDGGPTPLFLGADDVMADDNGGTEEQAEPEVENSDGDLLSGAVTIEGLSSLAEKENSVFQNFAAAYSAPVPEGAARRALLRLSKQAPGASFEAQVEDCGGGYLAARPGTAISVAALIGDYEGGDALVIGFATTEEPSGPLNRYTYVIWRAEDCATPLTSFGGMLLR